METVGAGPMLARARALLEPEMAHRAAPPAQSLGFLVSQPKRLLPVRPTLGAQIPSAALGSEGLR